MSFGQYYARSYDAFYRTKDYAVEAQFVHDCIGRICGGGPLRILDIGCGTGLHDIELLKAGHDVTGVDMSPAMLAHAEERWIALPAPDREHLRFVQGDARTLRTSQTYDAVISLFHVMSYMAGDGDFTAALKTARAHLAPGGAFLFDFWYGPAVMADPPQARERVVEEEGRRIRRTTTPYWDRDKDRVRILFHVEEDGKTTASEEHVMRYFFADGLATALLAAGLEIVESGEWLTGATPHEKTFGVYVLARAT